MSYTKHNWVNGETITDTLLNRMEDGIASSGGVLVATYTVTGVVDDNPQFVCDKTFQELNSFVKNGGGVVVARINTDDVGGFVCLCNMTYEVDYSILFFYTEVDPNQNAVLMTRLWHGHDEVEGDIIEYSPYIYPNDQ